MHVEAKLWGCIADSCNAGHVWPCSILYSHGISSRFIQYIRVLYSADSPKCAARDTMGSMADLVECVTSDFWLRFFLWTRLRADFILANEQSIGKEELIVFKSRFNPYQILNSHLAGEGWTVCNMQQLRFKSSWWFNFNCVLEPTPFRSFRSLAPWNLG
jgi:hypothetical protein